MDNRCHQRAELGQSLVHLGLPRSADPRTARGTALLETVHPARSRPDTDTPTRLRRPRGDGPAPQVISNDGRGRVSSDAGVSLLIENADDK